MSALKLCEVGLFVFVAACGGTTGDDRLGNDASSNDSGTTDATANDVSNTNGRVPLHHRSTALVCPTERGPGALPSGCDYDAGPKPACLADTDCTQGINGRCMHPDLVPVFCAVACSYDQCESDSDCPSGEPCSCRASGTDNAANVCLGGSQCRTDSDCGPGGYCSPSAGFGAFNCDTAYFCHTASDTCIDDSDCDGQLCQYDTTAAHWKCGGPTCAPPP